MFSKFFAPAANVNNNQPKFRRMVANAFNTLSSIPGSLNRNGYNISELLRLMAQLQYPYFVNYLDLEYLYNRHPLANRICNTFPKYTWNPRPVIVEMNNNKGVPKTAFEKAVAEIMEKVDFFNYMQRADVASQIGQYGCLYISYNDDANSAPSNLTSKKVPKKNPITKLDYRDAPTYVDGLGEVNWASLKGKGADAVKMVIPYKQPNAWPAQYITDPEEPAFALVAYYNLQSGGDVFGSQQNQDIVYSAAMPVTWNVVHSSRVIHVCDNNIQNNILGVPKLEPIFNDLLDLIRVTGGSSITYTLNARGGVVFSVKGDAQSTTTFDATGFETQLENYFATFKRALAVDQMDVKELDFKVYSPDKHYATYIKNISAGAEIPARILLGNEAAHLASTTDEANFDSLVKIRKESFATNQVRKLIDPLIANGVIPAPTSGNYKLHFPELALSDDTQNAENFNKVGLALSALANAKSNAIENEMDKFIAKANEILHIKGDDVELDLPAASFKRPDASAQDMIEAFDENEHPEALL